MSLVRSGLDFDPEAMGEKTPINIAQSRMVTNIAQQLMSEDSGVAAQGCLNIVRLVVSDGGMNVLLAEPAGQVALSQLGVLLTVHAHKGPQSTTTEKHAAVSASVAIAEIAKDDRGLRHLLLPPKGDGLAGGTPRRMPGIGAPMMEGLAVLLQEPELAVVNDACAAWAAILRSDLVLVPVAEMSDRRFRTLVVGLMGGLHIKGAEVMHHAGAALRQLAENPGCAKRMLDMPTLDVLLLQELTTLMRDPGAIRHASAILCSLAKHDHIRKHLTADAPNFELLLHQLALTMHENTMPYAAVVICAFAADVESRKCLLGMTPARPLITDLTDMINPARCKLPGPAVAVLRSLTEDWSSQARVLSIHPDPFLLVAACMFQVHQQQQMRMGVPDSSIPVKSSSGEVWVEPELQELLMQTERDASISLRQLVGTVDNFTYVMGKGTGLRQWPDLLQGAASILKNFQHFTHGTSDGLLAQGQGASENGGNNSEITAMAAAVSMCSICGAAGVRILAQDSAFMGEIVGLLTWILLWPDQAIREKALNGLYSMCGGMEDVAEEWALRFMDSIKEVLLEGLLGTLAALLHPLESSMDTRGKPLEAPTAAHAISRLSMKVLKVIASGRVGGFVFHKLMQAEQARLTPQPKAPAETALEAIGNFFGSLVGTAPVEEPTPSTGMPPLTAPQGLIDVLLAGLAQSISSGDLQYLCVPALGVLLSMSAYDVCWQRLLAMNTTVPMQIVSGLSATIMAGTKTHGLGDGLAICFWFTQDSVGMNYLESQHQADLRGMLDMLVEVWKHGDHTNSEMAGRTLSNLIHLGGKPWEHKLNAVHLVGSASIGASQRSFSVQM
mmetsp:Transcript_499/g.553  ORF Transcript_499/g.553 Transcript_499/m.553 type:complete len:840 (+) Transcript_499:152-2671(+)